MCLLGLLSGRFLAGLRRFRGVIFANITHSGEYNHYSYFGGSSKQVGRPSTSPRHQEYALYDSYRADARCLCRSCEHLAGCRLTRELRPFDCRNLKPRESTSATAPARLTPSDGDRCVSGRRRMTASRPARLSLCSSPWYMHCRPFQSSACRQPTRCRGARPPTRPMASAARDRSY